MSEPIETLPVRGIRRATEADLPDVGELLARAFLDAGPVADWLVPDRTARLEIYRRYFDLFARDALRRGVVEVNHEVTCAALWYGPQEALGHPENYDAQLAEITGRHLARFQCLDRMFAAVHPSEPHGYLAFIAVTPEFHSMGQGSRMVRHHLATLDRLGLPAYLEASNLQNRRLYERHGYEPIGEIQLPDGGPALYPMWRTATTNPAGGTDQ